MGKIIFTGQQGLTHMDKSTVKHYVACSGYSLDMTPITNAYNICNNWGPLSDHRDTFAQLFRALVATEGDVVFHDEFGKFRAYELASAYCLYMNKPLFKVFPTSPEVIEVDPTFSTTVENYMYILHSLVSSNEVALPTDMKKRQVAVTNSVRWPQNYSVEEITSYGDLKFLHAGFRTIAQAEEFAKLYNMEVKFHRVIPQSK